MASAHTFSSSTAGSGSSSQSQTTLQDVNVLNGLVAATAVKSNSSATCSNGLATPNLSLSLPGGISVVINQQTSSSGGTSGSMTVNALHVTGPSIDIVVASAQSISHAQEISLSREVRNGRKANPRVARNWLRII
jgi:hypothetical protein